MAQANNTIGICLFGLEAKEEAVLKRVVTFSGSQGRNYALTPLADAQLLVVSDDTPVDFAAMNPQGCMIVRIAEQESGQPYDVLMARPLLVTRVMRTLEEARKLLLESLGDGIVVAAPVPAPAPAPAPAPVPVVAPIPVPVPEPVPVPVVPPAVAAVLDITPVPTEPVSVEVTEVTSPVEATPVASPVAPVDVVAVASPEYVYHHKALVVDDSAAIRKQLELELREAGIASDFAESGEQALEKISSQRYDLIFLDIIMPGIDGYETCRQMRLRRELKKTPIIMLSAKTSPLDEVQGVIAGASTYLTKPVKSEQLQKTLKRVSMWLDNFQPAR